MREHHHSLTALTLALLAGSAAPGVATALYECPDAAGTMHYTREPCAGVEGQRLSIDRASPAPSRPVAPDARQGEGEAPHRMSATGRPGRLSGEMSRSAQREGPPMSADERQRIVRLRRAEPALSAEAAAAAEIEIAAIREGADARLTAADRSTLESLRVGLRAPDRLAREEALHAFRSVYARYRSKPRPRVQPTPGAIGAEVPSAPRPYPDALLGVPPPGTRGPLVAAPPGPAGTGGPRPGPYADPTTGQLLVPSGDRIVDPLTGTILMRSGRSYVDPATGRVVPAP
jgi:hypothetical protein